ncbi:DUF6476 family protein [Rhodospirillaceae bacterium SYSU D60014]|uniref:DUF6476 family protein n=1 Tax=Virgifigura deserti TaxID=2268457 RepID=UPI000E661A23
MQALKALVIIMGIMIIAGVAVVVVTIYNRLGGMAEEPAPTASAPAPAPANFGEAALAVPAGCRVTSTAAAGDRLILQLGPENSAAGACAQILVLDMETGSLLGRFILTPSEMPAE